MEDYLTTDVDFAMSCLEGTRDVDPMPVEVVSIAKATIADLGARNGHARRVYATLPLIGFKSKVSTFLLDRLRRSSQSLLRCLITIVVYFVL